MNSKWLILKLSEKIEILNEKEKNHHIYTQYTHTHINPGSRMISLKNCCATHDS